MVLALALERDDQDAQSGDFLAVVPRTDVAKLEAKQQGIANGTDEDDLVAAG